MMSLHIWKEPFDNFSAKTFYKVFVMYYIARKSLHHLGSVFPVYYAKPRWIPFKMSLENEVPTFLFVQAASQHKNNNLFVRLLMEILETSQ